MDGVTEAKKRAPLLSVGVGVYRGAPTLDDTFARLLALEKELPDGATMEIVAVDDGSDDDSYAKILENQKRYPGKIRAVKLSRNFGAVACLAAAMQMSRGDCVAVAPQDLQDMPPELLLKMFDAWRGGAKVNIGVRERREEPAAKKIPASLYHSLFRGLAARDYPTGGLGLFLVDRQVADEMLKDPEAHADPATRLFMMGYPRRLHTYHRAPPPKGMKSGWTLSKQIKLAIDNFIAFSHLPVRLMSAAGFLVAAASFIFAAYVFIGKITGWYPIHQPPGWATIVVLITFLLGLVMMMLGMVGEYLWRILDLARRRPMYLVDEVREGNED